MTLFKLPDLGEGLPDAEIVEWHIQEGDFIKVDQLMLAVETAKAIIEVPSPYSGQIIKLYGKKGEIISTGSPLVEFSLFDQQSENQPEKRDDTGTVVGRVEVGNELLLEAATQITRSLGGMEGVRNIKVLPAVRALAKKLNVDLAQVQPTGSEGLITREDVIQAEQSLAQAGPVQPLQGTRRTMALMMQRAHAEVVPVCVFDEADITEWSLGHRDYTVRLLQAMVYGCTQEPALNAWYDGASIGRRLLKGVHIGIAMDTSEGLFVPVIHDAQNKTASELRHTIEKLKKQVQERSVSPLELRGNSITLSNFGKFSGQYASPIVMPPTVAILGVGKVREAVRSIGGKILIRMILPLSLTFDHRAVTGGEATRFLGAVMTHLAQK